MHNTLKLSLLLALLSACKEAPAPKKAEASREIIKKVKAAKKPTDPKELAKRLSQELIIVDGHVDLPYRLRAQKLKEGKISEDVSKRTEKGDFDYVRAKAGGLDAPFMSIYVPAMYQKEGSAKAVADELIDMVEGIAKTHPDKFEVAHHPEDVRRIKKLGRVALPLGIENGAAIEDDLKNVAHFQKRGVRYITLTHSKDNLICDSSYDKTHTHKGLSKFGKEVVAEMNRVGIMVDISHVSDDAFHQTMAVAKVPAIASHSSCRHFTPDFERNMNDEMIKKLAKNGGVVMINYGSTFISKASQDYFNGLRDAAKAFNKDKKYDRNSKEMRAFVEDYKKKQPPVLATVKDVADHIEHVIKLVGVEHVGLGSDFDGVGDTLPEGLKDPEQLPNLLEELLKRGYSEADLKKICGENLLRVWEKVEAYAKAQASQKAQ